MLGVDRYQDGEAYAGSLSVSSYLTVNSVSIPCPLTELLSLCEM